VVTKYSGIFEVCFDYIVTIVNAVFHQTNISHIINCFSIDVIELVNSVSDWSDHCYRKINLSKRSTRDNFRFIFATNIGPSTDKFTTNSNGLLCIF
jgi:hypothetical protein